MATETWTIDGQNLSNFGYDIETFEGLDDVPSLVGDNMAYANRHGTEQTNKFFGEASKVISMMVRNTDPATGAVPATFDLQRQNYDANLDKLVRIFYRARRKLDVRRTMSDGSIRQAFAECVTGITPALLGLNSGKVAFELRIPDGFWQDVNNQTSAAYLPGVQTIAEWAAATAPMQDLKYRITGPATNPQLLDVESGAYFQYNGTVPALGWFEPNSADMSVATSGFVGWNPANLVHFGDPRWLTLYPSIDGCKLQFTASGTTGATNFTVTGKRKYLR